MASAELRGRERESLVEQWRAGEGRGQLAPRNCSFCHLCPPGEKDRRKKEKHIMARQALWCRGSKADFLCRAHASSTGSVSCRAGSAAKVENQTRPLQCKKRDSAKAVLQDADS